MNVTVFFPSSPAIFPLITASVEGAPSPGGSEATLRSLTFSPLKIGLLPGPKRKPEIVFQPSRLF